MSARAWGRRLCHARMSSSTNRRHLMAPKLNINKGERFGRLTVLEEVEPRVCGKQRQRAFSCRCDCGKETVVKLLNMRQGVTQSCGCIKRAERPTEPPPAVDGAAWIPLTEGKWALVDEADAPLVANRPWLFGTDGYAVSRRLVDGEWRPVKMHRLILGDALAGGLHTDHINRNRLDNRRCNLRVASRSQNQANRETRRGNRFKGVKRNGPSWSASVHFKGVRHYVGRIPTEVEAARVYNRLAREVHGEFARLNVIPEDQSS